MSIATEITRLQGAKSSLKTSIENKGVTVPSSTKLDGYSALVDQISTGATEAPENDVNFYDYDGFRVASYTITEAKALTALPTPPTHEGLTFQEWNWSLADIQGYNRRYIDIGANYIPTDGATHFKVVIPDDDLDTKMYINGKAGTLVIDWGDNTTSSNAFTNEARVTFTHTYASGGRYDIKFTFTQSDSTGFWTTYNKNIASSWSGNIFYEEIWCGNYFDLSALNSVANSGVILLAISKNTPSNFITGTGTRIIQINYPKNNTIDYSVKTVPVSTGRMCFPKSIVSLSASTVLNGFIASRLILPEWSDNSVLNDNALRNAYYVSVLSLPSCCQFSTGNATFQNFYALKAIDIVQGWTPATSLSFSYSTFLPAGAMVDFFNKLGTTTNAITLTFGSTNLGKLSADEKAIATNKGYTLA